MSAAHNRHPSRVVVALAALAVAGCSSSATGSTAATTAHVAVGATNQTSGTGPAGTTGGSRRGTTGWVNVTGNLAGHPSECGNTSNVSVRPDVDEVIAGIAQAGLWASTDPNSTTWAQLGTGAGSAVITNRTTSIVYDPDRPGTWWETGIYNAGGIYTTSDGGTTFSQVGDEITHTEALAIDFTDPKRATMLESRHEDAEVELSTDGGRSWTVVSGSLPDIGFAMVPLIVDRTTFLLGSRNGSQSGIYRSTDGGSSWRLVRSGSFAGAPVVMHDGTILWVDGSDLVASHDGGATWTTLAHDELASPSIADMGDGRLAGVLDDHLGTSSDGGVTWHDVGPPLPFEETGMTYSRARHAFYVWYFDCDLSRSNPVPDDAIMRWDLDPSG